jgi:hypothetical protein
MQAALGRGLPIITPPQKTIKVRVAPHMLPMFATICPVEIVRSEASDTDGLIILVLRGANLPDAEWGTIHCETKGCSSIVTIKAVNG